MIPKIRAWDKITKSITNVSALYYGSDFTYISYAVLTGGKLLYGPDHRIEDDFILMQSTGLKDKNGVEIFEGDIVEIIYDGKPFIGVIVYDQEETDFKATNGKEEYGSDFQYLGGNDSNEVIGNIYENADLLEEK